MSIAFLEPQGKPVNEPGAFLRIEDKFFIPKSLKDEFFELLKTEMTLCRFGSPTDFNINESVYFDSKDLDFFHHHFSPIKQRFKVRVRRYNPDQNNGTAYLESKCKIIEGLDKITIKKRFKLDARNYQRITNGQPLVLSPELKALNSNIKPTELADRVHLMNSLASTYFISPQLKVTYERVSFEKEDLRITVDENIGIQTLHNFAINQFEVIKNQPIWALAKSTTQNWNKESQLLVEVKHSGTMPGFIQPFLTKYGIEKTSFSKYCWGVVSGLEK